MLVWMKYTGGMNSMLSLWRQRSGHLVFAVMFFLFAHFLYYQFENL